ncbi:MAG: hypothetical protein A3I66_06375 [Burkholderiales bacterium RIFCSPLOWO2_02_FULL_57_36]|nr:MAG: hypothetical protein A3I66_06375 [Burkholderiales bacterium RIFCSPLOWO2_02_FULL_57_36]
MNKFRKTLLIGVTVLGLGSTAFITHAQTSPGERPDRAAMGGHHKWHGGAKSPEQMKERIAKRQAELHDKLKLDASQESAWQAFTAATTPNDQWKRPDRAEWEKLSAPERMEKQLGMMKEREARMTSRLAATKTFYATLTPEQQKVFNESFMSGRRHGKGYGKS